MGYVVRKEVAEVRPMRARQRLELSILLACIIELPFMLSPHLGLGFELTLVMFATWHYLPRHVLFWVERYHPLSNHVIQVVIFLGQVVVITPFVYGVLLLAHRLRQRVRPT